MNIDDINNLLFNPIWSGKLLHHFLSGACRSKSKRIKFELIYFALPFINDDIIFEQLIKCKNTSTFSSLFKSPDTKNNLIKKHDQIAAYKNITDNAIIYLGNKISISIDDFIQISDLVKYQNEDELLRSYCKAAFYLGIILTKEDYRNIFLRVG